PPRVCLRFLHVIFTQHLPSHHQKESLNLGIIQTILSLPGWKIKHGNQSGDCGPILSLWRRGISGMVEEEF
ncbi:MAG: hypothetical protein JW913_17750, partial [Chitinispirillaceae bacterium]|nr:hypothetical protein [Chitinispirillaceae bacterium]